MAPPRIAEAIATATGCTVVGSAPVSGGDINDAYRVQLDDGRSLFAKTHAQPPPEFFVAEADGLQRLAAAAAIRVPEVVAATDTMLVLEWIEPSPSYDAAELGRGLARLHRSPIDSFGLDRDNYVGTVPQDNTPSPHWPAFYVSCRLEPLIRRNVDRGDLPPETRTMFERLAARIDERCGPPEPPALVHGDLWFGNCFGADGQPVLIDAAVYGGHREMDLAMMRLFGGFDERTFAAYDELAPLADGHRERVALYQLYPLLVHVTLFGGSSGYGRALLDSLGRYA